MRLYAACLASYNNGVLHGRWIDASTDVDEMQEQVSAMLRESRFPNVTVKSPEAAVLARGWYRTSVTEPTDWRNDAPEFDGFTFATAQDVCDEYGIDPIDVPSAEEWAVHDYDGLPSSLGEYPGLQAIADFVEVTEEYSLDAEDLGDIVSYFGSLDYAKDELENRFAGRYESLRAYADERADEMLHCHGIKDDHPLAQYFDYERYSDEMRHSVSVVDLSDGVAIFYA